MNAKREIAPSTSEKRAESGLSPAWQDETQDDATRNVPLIPPITHGGPLQRREAVPTGTEMSELARPSTGSTGANGHPQQRCRQRRKGKREEC